MGVEIISNPLSVSALLSGEIDHHTAAAMRADIDAAAAALCRDNDMPVLIFDLGDSSRRYCASTSPMSLLWTAPPSVLSWVAIGFCRAGRGSSKSRISASAIIK